MAYYVLAKYGDLSGVRHLRTELVDLRPMERIILRSDRGTEAGTVVKLPFEGETTPEGGVAGEVLRRMTTEDFVRERQIEDVDEVAESKFCKEHIRSHGLPMKLVDVEHIFGGEKIIFYFLAEGRVDFRQLVKDLAREYRTRIELKQIGVRDEARLLADYDHCGREICCRTFIRKLEPVTMKMAKAQKATLDPSKISGRCGRLMCCLRYEDKTYDELKKQLPRKGAKVVTDAGTGEVIDYEILSQTVRVEMQDGHIVKVQMKDVKKVIPRDEKEYQQRQQERAQRRSQAAQSGDRGNAGTGPAGRGRRSRGKRRGNRPAQGTDGNGGKRPGNASSRNSNRGKGPNAGDRGDRTDRRQNGPKNNGPSSDNESSPRKQEG